jgi:SAM-dependent methyltransferase
MLSWKSDLRRVFGAQRAEPYASFPGGKYIELGCGQNKLRSDAIGVDQLAFAGVDIVGELPEALDVFESSSIDVVYSHHFIEHVNDIDGLLKASASILRTSGQFIAIAPHFSNPYFYSDPTHQTPFGLYSMSYFSRDQVHQRQVNIYATEPEPDFELVSAELRFKATVRQPGTFIISRSLEWITSRSVRAREFYERRLCWIWPCAEVRYVLRRTG